MDGTEICKNLREEGVDTPILMLTAKGELEDKIEGFHVGTDDYLSKPFAFEELVARIKALTKRKKDGIATKLQFADLTVDMTNFTVTRDGKDIQLSRKEFDLLVFLMRSSGKTLTKDQIIAGVWEYDSDVLPNTIEVYIGYLRSKIDKPFPTKPALIQTIRGFGYKIG
jgi:DNA-binding response OmpR family regulator